MSSETKIASRQIGNKTVVDVDAQNVDFRNCEAIKSAVAGMVAQGQKDILLNLSKVSFMDSSGLSVILFCKRTCEEVSGTFGVYGLQNYVNNLVNLTNLNKTIDIFKSEAEAVSV
jgi:anti-sigma B factor antagonist